MVKSVCVCERAMGSPAGGLESLFTVTSSIVKKSCFSYAVSITSIKVKQRSFQCEVQHESFDISSCYQKHFNVAYSVSYVFSLYTL